MRRVFNFKMGILMVLSSMSLELNAQVDWTSGVSARKIFPIINSSANSPKREFIAADAEDGNQYSMQIPHYYRAHKMWYLRKSS